MFGLHSTLSRNLTLLLLASFAFMNMFSVGMSMKVTNGQMSSCPFMAGHATMCKMNIMEHIAQWQQAFIGIPTKANFLALAAFAAVLILFIKPFSKLKKLTEFAARLFAYHKAHLVKVFDPLLLAFSDGILNPKIY